MDKFGLVILAVVLFKMAYKKKPNIINETTEEEILLQVEPRKLKVFCKSCGDTELKSGEIIPITGVGFFSVKGYTLKGEEVRLNSNELSWGSSCSCVKFTSTEGLDNCLSCSLGDKRDVWIKYSNGITFGWRIDFGKKGK